MEIKSKYQPQFYDNSEEAMSCVEKKGLFFVDAVPNQVAELCEIYKQAKYEIVEKYVCFPWNAQMVRIVGKEDYLELKSNRNRDLITADEQKLLRKFRVAILGLSVGSNIAFSVTQSGISNSITLMDPDTLDTTNLNRIPGGIHQIGLNKAIAAARRIYEDNPYANVRVDTRGMTKQGLEDLLKDGEIDCIVEEMDSISLKIETRFLAYKYGIPVVMVTDNGDGIVLHVERYDLGHDRIFDKDFKYWGDLLKTELKSKKAAGNIIMENMVGGVERVDGRMLDSVAKVLSKELVSWSQLGTAATLGGVVATYFIKQIALGFNQKPDIRAYISPEKTIYGTHLS